MIDRPGARRGGSTPSPVGTRPPLAVLFSVTVVGIMGTTLVSPVLPDLVADLGQPEGRAGLVIAAVALPGILVAPLVGLLADRFGRRRVLVPCLVLFGVGGLLAGAAGSFPALLAARVVQGTGAAGLINLVVVLIADHWDGEERARLLGRNSAVLTVFIAVMPLLGGLLAELGTWRWSFAAYGWALVVAAIVLVALPADRPVGTTASLAGQARDAGALLRDPGLRVAVGSAILLFVGMFAVTLTLLPLIGEERFGLSAGARGAILASTAIGSTTTSLTIAAVQRRVGRVGAVRIGTTTFAVGIVLMGAAPHPAVLVIGAIVTGVAEGLVIPTLQAVVTELAPPAQRGAAVAVFVSGTRTGQTVGPLLAGAAVAAVGGPSEALWVVVVVYVLLAWPLVRRQSRLDPRPS